MSFDKAIEKLSPLSEYSIYILLSLYDGEKHGYGVILKTREWTDGKTELKTATVYAAINRFIEYGLVEHTKEFEGKKYYKITKEGVAFLKHEYNKIRLLNNNIEAVMHEEEL